MRAFEGFDGGQVVEEMAELIDATQQAAAGEGFDGERDRRLVADGEFAAFEVDADAAARIGEEARVRFGVHGHRQKAVLQRVRGEDVGDRSGDDGSETEVQERPWRVLARGAASEIVAGDEDAVRGEIDTVEQSVGAWSAVGVMAPIIEDLAAEAFARGGGGEARRDDLVGVDARLRQHDGAGSERGEGLAHEAASWTLRGSLSTPATAVAAAVAGLARMVRAPLPWRPSKLRFEVDTASWPGATTSPFMAMHMEQPGRRHSAPASVKTRSRPSASASRRTASEPGTTRTRTLSFTRRPRSTAAAARRSLMRPLVQLPMKTTSTGCDVVGALAAKRM